VKRKVRIRAVAAAIAVAASVQITGAQAAHADAAGPAASCLGIEASALSPPGSSDEVLGGMSAAVAEVREGAGDLGIPAGAIFSFIAELHEGSHEACDAAVG
jgi:hypothetical protein